jgi:hypothetical protein
LKDRQYFAGSVGHRDHHRDVERLSRMLDH